MLGTGPVVWTLFSFCINATIMSDLHAFRSWAPFLASPHVMWMAHQHTTYFFPRWYWDSTVASWMNVLCYLHNISAMGHRLSLAAWQLSLYLSLDPHQRSWSNVSRRVSCIRHNPSIISVYRDHSRAVHGSAITYNLVTNFQISRRLASGFPRRSIHTP